MKKFSELLEEVANKKTHPNEKFFVNQDFLRFVIADKKPSVKKGDVYKFRGRLFTVTGLQHNKDGYVQIGINVDDGEGLEEYYLVTGDSRTGDYGVRPLDIKNKGYALMKGGTGNPASLAF